MGYTTFPFLTQSQRRLNPCFHVSKPSNNVSRGGLYKCRGKGKAFYHSYYYVRRQSVTVCFDFADDTPFFFVRFTFIGSGVRARGISSSTT